jgi:hypothetical protein
VSPAPLPQPVARSPDVERRARAVLIALLLLAPVCNAAHLIVARMLHEKPWAGSIGALAFICGAPLAGVGFFALVRASWTAWAAWALAAMTLLFVGAGDCVESHVPPVRLGLALVLLAAVSTRIIGLQRAERRG